MSFYKLPIKFSRLFYIGFTLFLSKLFLFILPYLSDIKEYNEFNKVYYFSTLIAAIGSFGFDFAFTKIKIRYWLIILLSAFNLLIAALVVSLFGVNLSGTALDATGFLIALFTVLFNIFSFEVLFSTFYKKYFFIYLASTFTLLSVLVLHYFTGINLIFLFCFATVAAFCLCLPFFNKGSYTGLQTVKDFYSAGAYAFVINSAAGLAFSIDKYFVNHFFNIHLAGAYTFSWILISPAFYIGNLFEKDIYAEKKNTSLNKTVNRAVLYLCIALLAYFACIIFIIYYIPSILPSSIDRDYIKNVFPLMMSGYFIYILIHFPMNALLFKAGSLESQKTITILHLGIISIFLTALFLAKGHLQIDNYAGLLGIIWVYLLGLLSSKILVLKKHKTFALNT